MIHPSVKIHPTSVIEGDVRIGPDCEIGALCFLQGPIEIGRGTKIYPHCVVGLEGEHRSRGPEGRILIGENCVIRELTVIQRGTGDRETQIGDGCYVMDHCHIAHDVIVESESTISPNVVLGGHTHVLNGATLGIGTVTHQFSTIGAFVMIGMGSVITKDVPPFALVAGNPARFRRLNAHGLKRAGLGESDLLVTDGSLASDHPTALRYLDSFRSHLRPHRSVMALST